MAETTTGYEIVSKHQSSSTRRFVVSGDVSVATEIADLQSDQHLGERVTIIRI
jgi:hypothetical protein